MDQGLGETKQSKGEPCIEYLPKERDSIKNARVFKAEYLIFFYT